MVGLLSLGTAEEAVEGRVRRGLLGEALDLAVSKAYRLFFIVVGWFGLVREVLGSFLFVCLSWLYSALVRFVLGFGLVWFGFGFVFGLVWFGFGWFGLVLLFLRSFCLFVSRLWVGSICRVLGVRTLLCFCVCFA